MANEDNARLAAEVEELRKRVKELEGEEKRRRADEAIGKQAEAELGRSLNYAGVRIFTTLDPELQIAASRAVRQGVIASLVRSSSQSSKAAKDGRKELPQGALVSLEACTGRVRALVEEYRKEK